MIFIFVGYSSYNRNNKFFREKKGCVVANLIVQDDELNEIRNSLLCTNKPGVKRVYYVVPHHTLLLHRIRKAKFIAHERRAYDSYQQIFKFRCGNLECSILEKEAFLVVYTHYTASTRVLSVRIIGLLGHGKEKS